MTKTKLSYVLPPSTHTRTCKHTKVFIYLFRKSLLYTQTHIFSMLRLDVLSNRVHRESHNLGEQRHEVEIIAPNVDWLCNFTHKLMLDEHCNTVTRLNMNIFFHYFHANTYVVKKTHPNSTSINLIRSAAICKHPLVYPVVIPALVVKCFLWNVCSTPHPPVYLCASSAGCGWPTAYSPHLSALIAATW